MKKSLLSLLLIPVALLTACNPSTPPSSKDDMDDMFGSDDEGGMDFDGDKVKVYFFESAVKVDMKNPLLTYEVALGSKLTKPEKDPESTDPGFNVFKGWSNKPVVMSEDDYWNFDEDTIPTYIPDLTFRLYGQWEYVA